MKIILGKSIFHFGGLHLKMLFKTKQYTFAVEMQIFPTRFCYIALVVLELARYTSWPWTESIHLSDGIKYMCHHTWPHTNFFLSIFFQSFHGHRFSLLTQLNYFWIYKIIHSFSLLYGNLFSHDCFITFNYYYFVCSWCVGACYGTCVEVVGQLCRISLFYLCMDSGNWTQVARLEWQASLLAKPFSGPPPMILLVT